MLGNTTAAVFNLLNIVRGLGFAFEKNKKPYVTMFGMWIIYIVVTVFTYSDFMSVMILSGILPDIKDQTGNISGMGSETALFQPSTVLDWPKCLILEQLPIIIIMTKLFRLLGKFVTNWI